MMMMMLTTKTIIIIIIIIISGIQVRSYYSSFFSILLRCMQEIIRIERERGWLVGWLVGC